MRLSRSVAGIRVRQWAAVPVLVAAAVVGAAAQPAPAPGQRPALRVVGASPNGEVATLAEANEIRVVFSEPMVVLGSVPARVTAPFFSVTPAIPGSFRWSGTTILVFTPDANAGRLDVERLLRLLDLAPLIVEAKLHRDQLVQPIENGIQQGDRDPHRGLGRRKHGRSLAIASRRARVAGSRLRLLELRYA